jgi:PhzF family phenazine biosynthesis protein
MNVTIGPVEVGAPSWIGLFESFASRPFGGNLAGVVVSESEIDHTIMLGLASDIAAPTTGFVSRDTASAHEAHVRFFTPTQEIDACGHVIIAVAQALHDLNIWSDDQGTTITCDGGTFPIERSQDRFVMKQSPRHVSGPKVRVHELGELLGVDVVSVQTAATGLKHLFAETSDVDDLSLITASHSELAALGKQNHVDTIGIYARLEPGRVRLRDFTAPIGVLEEPASGTTSGALGTLIGASNLIVEQGVEMGRPSELHVSFDGSTVQVAGVARRVLSGELD